jgi:hypothetical protein
MPGKPSIANATKWTSPKPNSTFVKVSKRHLRKASQKRRLSMGKDWILTPFETAVFIAATAMMAGGFVMLASG